MSLDSKYEIKNFRVLIIRLHADTHTQLKQVCFSGYIVFIVNGFTFFFSISLGRHFSSLKSSLILPTPRGSCLFFLVVSTTPSLPPPAGVSPPLRLGAHNNNFNNNNNIIQLNKFQFNFWRARTDLSIHIYVFFIIIIFILLWDHNWFHGTLTLTPLPSSPRAATATANGMHNRRSRAFFSLFLSLCICLHII